MVLKTSKFEKCYSIKILKHYHNVTEDVLYRGDDVWDYALENGFRYFIHSEKTKN